MLEENKSASLFTESFFYIISFRKNRVKISATWGWGCVFTVSSWSLGYSSNWRVRPHPVTPPPVLWVQVRTRHALFNHFLQGTHQHHWNLWAEFCISIPTLIKDIWLAAASLQICRLRLRCAKRNLKPLICCADKCAETFTHFTVCVSEMQQSHHFIHQERVQPNENEATTGTKVWFQKWTWKKLNSVSTDQSRC